MSKPLYVIASPHAGTKAKTIDDLKAALQSHGLDYQLKIAKDPPAAYRAVSQLPKDTYGAVAAFGGDGTIIAVLKAAYKQQLPTLMLPGGSANALAKGVDMPSSLDACIRLYASGTYALRYLNVALLHDDEPFLLDLHAGVAAESVMNTPRHLKRRFGEVAYFISALRLLKDAQRQDYELTIDGREIAMSGYICMVVNQGRHDFLGIPMFNWPLAGSLSVAIVRSFQPGRVLMWLLVRRLTGRNLSRVMKTWRAQTVILRKVPTEILSDDNVVTIKLPLEVSMSPHTAMVIAPITEGRPSLRSIWLLLRTNFYRYLDHVKRLVLGVPSRNYCQVSPHLYVGGSFRRQALVRLRQWGITGIVSMQERLPSVAQGPEVDVLHLPTRDHTPPTLESLTKGVQFITKQIDGGGAAYVHCRLGEGRGPTMAIAYLMSRGMKLDDAQRAIRKFRPFVRPNKSQLRQLARWHETQVETPPDR